MNDTPKGMIARIHVSDGPSDAWPIAERISRGWQSGAHFYPDEKVVEVTTVYRPVLEVSYAAQYALEYPGGLMEVSDEIHDPESMQQFVPDSTVVSRMVYETDWQPVEAS